MIRNLIITLTIVFFALIIVSVGIANLFYVPTTPPFAEYSHLLPGSPAKNVYMFAGDVEMLYFHFDKPFIYFSLTPHSPKFIRRIFAIVRNGRRYHPIGLSGAQEYKYVSLERWLVLFTTR